MKKACLVFLFIAMILIAFSAGCTSEPIDPGALEKNVEKTDTSSVQSNVKYVIVSPGSVDAKVGYTVQFTANALDTNRNYLSTKRVAWTVEDKGGQASISSNGVLTPEQTGTVVVIATIEGKSSTALVTIKSAPKEKRYYHYYRSYDDDYRYNHYDYEYHDDSQYSNLPAGHCYYRDDTLEKLTAERVPCGRS